MTLDPSQVACHSSGGILELGHVVFESLCERSVSDECINPLVREEEEK